MSEPFDRAELIEELDGDIEFLAETFEMFVEDSTDLLFPYSRNPGNIAGSQIEKLQDM